MTELKKMMLDEIRKNTHIQSSVLDETEELIDTGLEKNDENVTAAALAYLDDKGYRRRLDNLEIAKKKILETSEGYDTVIVRKKRVVETDIFEKASIADLRDVLLLEVANGVTEIRKDMDRMSDKQYEYIVDYVDEVRLEFDRPKKGHLGEEEFKSFEEGLNEYASSGWELNKIFKDPKTPRLYLVFKREKMD